MIFSSGTLASGAGLGLGAGALEGILLGGLGGYALGKSNLFGHHEGYGHGHRGGGYYNDGYGYGRHEWHEERRFEHLSDRIADRDACFTNKLACIDKDVALNRSETRHEAHLETEKILKAMSEQSLKAVEKENIELRDRLGDMKLMLMNSTKFIMISKKHT